MEQLMGTFEIGEHLEVSRTRVHQIIARDDFPEPVARLKCGAIWRRGPVERWAKRNNYPREQ